MRDTINNETFFNTYKVFEEEALKLSEIAYLEAIKPKELQNQEVISVAYKRAKRLTNRLVNAGYWEKPVKSRSF